jgi:hypothetical protein
MTTTHRVSAAAPPPTRMNAVDVESSWASRSRPSPVDQPGDHGDAEAVCGASIRNKVPVCATAVIGAPRAICHPCSAVAPTEFAPVLDEVPSEVTPSDPADVDADAASPEAATAPEVETPVSVEIDAAASAAAPAERILPEIEHAIGATRQSILDEFLDSDRAELSMSEIKRALPNVPPGTIEACVRREWQQGRLLRVSPGTYRLAPPRPAEPPKPAPPPEPVRADGISDEQWLAWLGDWRAGGKWEGPGNPPDHPGCAVPPGVIAKHNDAARKRAERQRDREAA